MAKSKGPGALASAKLAKLGIPVTVAAKEIGINYQTFKKVLDDKSFSVETALKLEKYLGDVKAKDLAAMEYDMKSGELKASAKFQAELKKISKAKAPAPKAKAPAKAKKAPAKAKKAKAPAKKGGRKPKAKASPDFAPMM
jgi:plasmid maintenance system antidote protein VapI